MRCADVRDLATDGGYKVVRQKIDLAALQAGVGGHIECVRLDPSLDMWINEEGKINGLAPNWLATEIAIHAGAIGTDDWIAGNVVLTGGADDEGETMPLHVTDLPRLRKMLDVHSGHAILRLFGKRPNCG